MIASFLASALSGTGVGGGGLLVIYLSMIKGTAQSAAQGINLLFFEASSLGALPLHKKYRKMRCGVILIIGIFGLIGSVFGTMIAKSISPTMLKKLFGAFLIITGTLSMFKK